MSGIFGRDIWGIIFELLEKEFDPFTLNNLSATCRKLHALDMQRRQSYIKQYEKQGTLIEKLKTGRQDYVKLVRYAAITCHFYKYYYFQVTFENVINWLQRIRYKVNLTRMTEEEIVTELLEKTKVKQFKKYKDFEKDMELVQNQVNWMPGEESIYFPDYCCVFTFIKNDGDPINTIMDLQSMYD